MTEIATNKLMDQHAESPQADMLDLLLFLDEEWQDYDANTHAREMARGVLILAKGIQVCEHGPNRGQLRLSISGKRWRDLLSEDASDSARRIAILRLIHDAYFEGKAEFDRTGSCLEGDDSESPLPQAQSSTAKPASSPEQDLISEPEEARRGITASAAQAILSEHDPHCARAKNTYRTLLIRKKIPVIGKTPEQALIFDCEAAFDTLLETYKPLKSKSDSARHKERLRLKNKFSDACIAVCTEA